MHSQAHSVSTNRPTSICRLTTGARSNTHEPCGPSRADIVSGKVPSATTASSRTVP
jgi:hypothetical protein